MPSSTSSRKTLFQVSSDSTLLFSSVGVSLPLHDTTRENEEEKLMKTAKSEKMKKARRKSEADAAAGGTYTRTWTFSCGRRRR
jgi:hypothetical protein